MKIGIAIDDWKLPFFERHLAGAAFVFEKHRGVTADTFVLKIEAPNVDALTPVVRAANKEAREAGKPR